MAKSHLFADLLRRYQREGTGRDAWLDATVSKQPRGRKWEPKDFAAACGVTPRTERYWRSGKKLPDDSNIIETVLFGETPATDQRLELRAAIDMDKQARTATEIRIADIRLVQTKRWTGRELAEKLEELDHLLIEALTDDDEAPPDILANAYMDYPDTWRLVVDQSDRIVGYWRFVPLTAHWYERARSGLLLDKELAVETMNEFWLPGTYDIHVPIMGILPEYRNAKGVRLLFESFIDVLSDLAKSDIFIGRVCATAFSITGVRLCQALEMTHLRDHVSRGIVFEDSMTNIISELSRKSPHLLKNRPALVRSYGADAPVPSAE